MNYLPPHLIDVPRIGESSLGYISVQNCQSDGIPFAVKRIFWTYHTPESIVRGRHAHKLTEQMLFAVAGSIVVTLQSAAEDIITFRLDSPNIGLYVPPNYWHSMQYSHTAVQMVFASTEYDESDYLRNFDLFKQFWNNPK